jgi:hypothetical protein
MRSAAVAYRLAHRELAGLGYGSFESVVRRLRQLDAENLREACRRLFPNGRAAVLVVNGPPPRDREARAAPEKDGRVSAPPVR